MSHFSTVKGTKVIDPEAFIKAMAELGMTEVKRDTTIRAWASGDKAEKVELFCSLPGQKYGVGLRKVGSHYEMISDWSLTGSSLPMTAKAKIPHHSQFPGEDLWVAKEGHGVARQACDEFRGLAIQLTTRHTILRKYSKQGFMAKVTTDSKNNIVIKLTR